MDISPHWTRRNGDVCRSNVYLLPALVIVFAKRIQRVVVFVNHIRRQVVVVVTVYVAVRGAAVVRVDVHCGNGGGE